MAHVLLSSNEAQALSIDAVLEKLPADKNGLSTDEATNRLAQYGPNEIAEKKLHPILKFLSYFWGPIPWMIEAAAILSAVIHHWEDFFIIFVLLLLNAVVGFWQEHKADNAIALLKKKLSLQARVKRDGQWQVVPSRMLVPGDLVRIRLGEIVPADLKLTNGDYLLADESALTGESLPVEKHTGDVAYAGAVIRQGEMEALVVATGMHTYFGETATLVAEAKTQSHFQKAVIKIGNYLIFSAVLLVAVIILVALFRHENTMETVQFALVLTVAAIPVALPPVLSVTMAVGATALAKKEAIVSKLLVIEEMAGMDILCSDKTGTITKNELTLGEVAAFPGFTAHDVLLDGALASREEDGDPIDSAIIAQAKQALSGHSGTWKLVSFKPFDPVSKRTEATLEDARGKRYRVTKGAPQVILDLIEDKEAVRENVETGIDAFAGRGYRSLGVARADDAGHWHYVGIISLYDPPREDSAQTIQMAQAMGVEVKMLTGDHVAIAKEIARQVGLRSDIQPVAAFIDKPDREAEQIVEAADGFAQVFPEHKYQIVQILQARGHIVGMTGDGVNDAPALKKADAGIAVAGATDAAKSAADIVLTRPGLSVIIDAIKESRRIFQRMNSYAIYRIAETIRVLFFITLSILVFRFYPITAIMIVLLALFNDAPIMAIAYDNVRYADKPEQWNMRVVLGMATFLGIIGVISSFFIFYIGEHVFHLSRDLVQSFIFLKLAVAGHLTIFVSRTRGPFWSLKPGAALFWSAVVTKVFATMVVIFGWYVAPLNWHLALFVWIYALIAFVFTDFLKVALYRILDHKGILFSRQRE